MRAFVIIGLLQSIKRASCCPILTTLIAFSIILCCMSPGSTRIDFRSSMTHKQTETGAKTADPKVSSLGPNAHSADLLRFRAHRYGQKGITLSNKHGTASLSILNALSPPIFAAAIV